MKKEIIDLDSISEMHKVYGLGKPTHPLISIIDLKTLKPEIVKSDAVYRMAYYIISYKNYEGALKYGKSNYDFKEGTMMFTSPSQVIGGNPGEYKLHEGWAVYFHPDLINGTSLGQTIHNYSFFHYDVNEALHVSEEEKNVVHDCMMRIKKESAQNFDKHTQHLIISNLELLLTYCDRFYERQFLTRSKVNNDIVQRFERLLHDYFQADKSVEAGLPDVKYFSDHLNLSTNYLSDLLKKFTGKTPLEHIHLYLIEKAKSMLWSTEKSISEIAYKLGFGHPSHFTKLFKNKTGKSPREFRNLN